VAARIDIIVRISSARIAEDDAWAALSELIPADWKPDRDWAVQHAADGADEIGTISHAGMSFPLDTADDDVESVIERAVRSLESRQALIRRLHPDVAFQCMLRLRPGSYVDIEVSPALSKRAGDLGLDLILLPPNEST